MEKLVKQRQITPRRFITDFNDFEVPDIPQKGGIKPLFKFDTSEIEVTEFEKDYCKISGLLTLLDFFGIPVDEVLLPLDLVLGNLTSWRKVAKYISNGEILDKALPSIAVIVVKEGIENIYNITLPNSNTIINSLIEECALTPELLIELIISSFSLFTCIRKGMPREDALGFVVKESDEKFINFFKLLLNYIPESNNRDISNKELDINEYYPIVNFHAWGDFGDRVKINIIKTGIDLEVSAIPVKIDLIDYLKMVYSTTTGAVFDNSFYREIVKEYSHIKKETVYLHEGIVYAQSPIMYGHNWDIYDNLEVYPLITEKDYSQYYSISREHRVTKVEGENIRTSGNLFFSANPFKIHTLDENIGGYSSGSGFTHNGTFYYVVDVKKYDNRLVDSSYGKLLPLRDYNHYYISNKKGEINFSLYRGDISVAISKNKYFPVIATVGQNKYINTYQLLKDNLDNDIDEIFYWLKLVIRDTENGNDSYDNYLTDEDDNDDTPNPPPPTPDIPTPEPPITPPPETEPTDKDKNKGGGFIIPPLPPIAPPSGNLEIPDIPTPNIGNIPNVVLPNIGRGNAVYEMNYAKLKEFSDKMYGNDILQKIADFKFNLFGNPIDYLISLHEIYIDPLNDADNEIYLGFYGLGIQAPVITQRYQKLNCGKIDLTNYGKDYYKYAPYTTLKIYLPFIGIVDININDFADGFIECEYVIDVYTGVCVCTLYSIKDNKLFKNQYTANCIAQLPVSYTSESFTSNMIKGAISGGISGGGVGAGIGALSGALSGGVNISSTGHLEGSAGAMSYKKPFIIITTPEYKDIENKSIFRGVPVYTTKKIGEIKGFCKCIDIRLQSSCNLNEYNQIINLLKEGVIV